jgi:large subunit ribosomal protein L21
MFAILETGGKQYKVEVGDVLEVELLPAEKISQDTVTFSEIMLVNREGEVTIGDPFVKNASVSAKLLGAFKAEKVTVFKKKAKKGFKRTRGHRQNLHRVQIEKIEIQ